MPGYYQDAPVKCKYQCGKEFSKKSSMKKHLHYCPKKPKNKSLLRRLKGVND